MKQVRFFLSFVILLSGLIISAEACKTSESTTATSAADTTKTTQEKNPIHTNGNVQGGTIMNGPAPSNSPTGSKPKQ